MWGGWWELPPWKRVEKKSGLILKLEILDLVGKNEENVRLNLGLYLGLKVFFFPMRIIFIQRRRIGSLTDVSEANFSADSIKAVSLGAFS